MHACGERVKQHRKPTFVIKIWGRLFWLLSSYVLSFGKKLAATARKYEPLYHMDSLDLCSSESVHACFWSRSA